MRERVLRASSVRTEQAAPAPHDRSSGWAWGKAMAGLRARLREAGVKLSSTGIMYGFRHGVATEPVGEEGAGSPRRRPDGPQEYGDAVEALLAPGVEGASPRGAPGADHDAALRGPGRRW